MFLEKKNDNQNKENIMNEIKNNLNQILQNESIKNDTILTNKLDKLKNAMMIYNKKKNKEEINYKKLNRDVFVNYTNNIKFVIPNVLNKKKSFKKEFPNLEKENIQKNIYLRKKNKRENKFSNNILNDKSKDNDNKNYVIFQNGIIKIRTNEINDSNGIDNNIQLNYRNLTSIKKLLIQLNLKISTERNKLIKKYFFGISNIFFVITVNNSNLKIIEIYEKKGDKETIIDSDKCISKELCRIKNYLEKNYK